MSRGSLFRVAVTVAVIVSTVPGVSAPGRSAPSNGDASVAPLAPVGPDGTGPAPDPPIGEPWSVERVVSLTEVHENRVVACGDGYTWMVAGRDARDRMVARFWVSDDGDTWTRAGSLRPDPRHRDGWQVSELLSVRGGLFALGGDGRRLAVWRSGDCGRSWRQLDRTSFGLGRDAFGISQGVEAAVAGDRMLVIASQGGEGIPHRRWAWTMDPDGRWRRIAGGLDGRVDDGLGSTGSRFFGVDWVTGDPGGSQLVTSSDGVTWTPAGALPSAGSVTWDPDGQRFLTVTQEPHDAPAAAPVLWQSSTGSMWTMLATGAPSAVTYGSTVAAGHGSIVWTVDAGEPRWSWIATSTDSGEIWSVSAGWPGQSLVGPSSIAIGSDTTLIAGGGWEGRARLWREPAGCETACRAPQPVGPRSATPGSRAMWSAWTSRSRDAC